MKQGIRCSYWGLPMDTPVELFIDKAKKLEFDVLELEAGMIMNRSDQALRELGKYASDRGIGLTVGGGSMRELSMCDADPAVRQRGISWRSELIRKMELTGASVLCGPMHAYWPYDFTGDVDKEGERARAVESLKELGRIAGEYGVMLCVEVVNRYENPILNTAAEGVSFCRDVDSRSVKLLLDTFHMNIEEDSLPGAIRTAGSFLGHLHTGESNRKVPGKGHLPWREICETLFDIGYTGIGVMEPVVLNEVPGAKAFRLWRRLVNGGEEQLDLDARQAARYMRAVWSGVADR